MKTSLSVRLALSYLAVILIGMGVVIPLAWLTVERLYLNTQSASLLAQAQLIAAALGSEASLAAGDEHAVEPYMQLSNVQPGIHTRVIDAQGAVVIALTGTSQPAASEGLTLPQLAQNAAGLVTSEELLSRAEIAQALQGQPATEIRRVEAAGGQRVLYAAAPVISQDGMVTQIVYLATPLPDTGWTALSSAMRWQLAGVLLLAILLASGAGLLLARRITSPLGKLAQAAHAVASGNLNQVAPEDRSISELAVLGRAFNTMTTSLRQSDQAKKAFIADVTHELRTPLTVIQGTIETLEDGALDDLQARGPFLASMSVETERLIRLVNDLLVLTRADAGVLNLQPGRLDLLEFARARGEHFAPLASQRNIQIKITAEPSSGEKQPAPGGFAVSADPDRLAQVLDNLLDNALRYSPEHGEIIVSLKRKDDRVICRVSDAGPGIPADHLPLIFERFYRADPSRNRDKGGSGLGLAIVRSLVVAHGGGVSASSVEGQGTAVTFWLPAAQPDD
ncbi:MAG: HAMP domain-containing protein [Anaerolineales bacterium]|nr:HAMP domain-containing protein [Anaerolineales bacterium]